MARNKSQLGGKVEVEAQNPLAGQYNVWTDRGYSLFSLEHEPSGRNASSALPLGLEVIACFDDRRLSALFITGVSVDAIKSKRGKQLKKLQARGFLPGSERVSLETTLNQYEQRRIYYADIKQGVRDVQSRESYRIMPLLDAVEFVAVLKYNNIVLEPHHRKALVEHLLRHSPVPPFQLGDGVFYTANQADYVQNALIADGVIPPAKRRPIRGATVDFRYLHQPVP